MTIGKLTELEIGAEEGFFEKRANAILQSQTCARRRSSNNSERMRQLSVYRYWPLNAEESRRWWGKDVLTVRSRSGDALCESRNKRVS